MEKALNKIKIYSLQNIKIKDIIVSLFLIVFCFFDFFSNLYPFFNYLDEVVAILAIVYYLYNLIINKTKEDKSSFVILLFVILISILGIIGNIFFKYQTRLFVISLDVLSTFKYVFVYLGASSYFKKNNSSLSVKKAFISLSEIYILILFVLGIVNLFFDIGMSNEIRYGIKNFSFIFDIPGIVINHCCVCALAIFSKKKISLLDTITLLLCAAVMAMTLKSRGFIMSVALILILLLKIKNAIDIKFRYILILSIILILIGLPQFEYYFIENNGPRLLFFENSFNLANKYYVFGTGFSTFGSGTASQYYSSLYYELGFNLRYGMSPDLNLYLNDTFWPSVLGQFGYVGFIAYFSILCIINLNLIKKYKQYIFTVSFLLINAWFSSIQSAFITSSYFISELLLCFVLCNAKE